MTWSAVAAVLLAVTGVRLLAAVTPVGGVAFIAAWLVLAWVLVRP
jgi:uncharacterized membrane protein YgdD (TMEM256/DUF423 family)